MGDLLPVLEGIESLPFLSVLMNLLHPMAPAKFISQLSLSFCIFTCLLDYFGLIFVLVAFCAISLAFLYLQMSLICTGNIVVLCLLVLSWVHFDFSKLLP